MKKRGNLSAFFPGWKNFLNCMLSDAKKNSGNPNIMLPLLPNRLE